MEQYKDYTLQELLIELSDLLDRKDYEPDWEETAQDIITLMAKKLKNG